MELKGTVRNVVDFGAFVDVGVHQDGLVHISKLANRFVKHPSDVVRVGEHGQGVGSRRSIATARRSPSPWCKESKPPKRISPLRGKCRKEGGRSPRSLPLRQSGVYCPQCEKPSGF